MVISAYSAGTRIITPSVYHLYNTATIVFCITRCVCMRRIISNTDSVETAVKTQLKSIISADMLSTLENAANHQSVKLAKGINWIRVWDAARDRGRTDIVQSFYRLLTILCTCLWRQTLLEM